MSVTKTPPFSLDCASGETFIWRDPGDTPPFGDRTAVDFFNIHRHINRFRSGNVTTDTKQICTCVDERNDSFGRESTRNQNFYVIVTGLVYSGAYFRDEAGGDAAPFTGGIQSDAFETFS